MSLQDSLIGLNQLARFWTQSHKIIKNEASAILSEAKEYTDQVKSDIYGGVPSATLDTLTELATAFEENKEVVDALDAAITTKANQSDLEVIQVQVLSDSFVLADAVTGTLYKIQIHEGQLVSFPVEE